MSPLTCCSPQCSNHRLTHLNPQAARAERAVPEHRGAAQQTLFQTVSFVPQDLSAHKDQSVIPTVFYSGPRQFREEYRQLLGLATEPASVASRSQGNPKPACTGAHGDNSLSASGSGDSQEVRCDCARGSEAHAAKVTERRYSPSAEELARVQQRRDVALKQWASKAAALRDRRGELHKVLLKRVGSTMEQGARLTASASRLPVSPGGGDEESYSAEEQATSTLYEQPSESLAPRTSGMKRSVSRGASFRERATGVDWTREFVMLRQLEEAISKEDEVDLAQKLEEVREKVSSEGRFGSQKEDVTRAGMLRMKELELSKMCKQMISALDERGIRVRDLVRLCFANSMYDKMTQTQFCDKMRALKILNGSEEVMGLMFRRVFDLDDAGMIDDQQLHNGVRRLSQQGPDAASPQAASRMRKSGRGLPQGCARFERQASSCTKQAPGLSKRVSTAECLENTASTDGLPRERYKRNTMKQLTYCGLLEPNCSADGASARGLLARSASVRSLSARGRSAHSPSSARSLSARSASPKRRPRR